ncbi:MAG: hypothetical protein AAF671_01330, partial [Pseudomonadota bacterium]
PEAPLASPDKAVSPISDGILSSQTLIGIYRTFEETTGRVLVRKITAQHETKQPKTALTWLGHIHRIRAPEIRGLLRGSPVI